MRTVFLGVVGLLFAVGDDRPSSAKTVRLVRGQILSVDDLELGDSIEGGIVALSSSTGVSSERRVQTQYETSVTISGQ